MSCVIYNDSECHTPKLSTFLAFYPFARRQFARAPASPECQFCQSARLLKRPVSFARAPEFASFARVPVCQSVSFARASASPDRAPVLLERQFCHSASLLKCQSVLPECQFCQSATEFCQSASFARAPVC